MINKTQTPANTPNFGHHLVNKNKFNGFSEFVRTRIFDTIEEQDSYLSHVSRNHRVSYSGLGKSKMTVMAIPNKKSLLSDVGIIFKIIGDSFKLWKRDPIPYFKTIKDPDKANGYELPYLIKKATREAVNGAVKRFGEPKK